MSKTQKTEAVKVAKAAKSVSIAVFLSRLLGLIREQVFAGLFGASTQMDAFVVAFRIPNLLRDLFAEGALSSAFITVFADYEQNRSQKETKQLVRIVFTAIFLIISTICLLGIIFSKELVLVMAPEFQAIPGKLELTVHLTQIMFPFLLFISLAALLMGILNNRGYFFIPAFASSCFNMGSIVVGGGLALIFAYMGYPGIYGMAIGTLAGGAFQMLIQLPIFKREGFSLMPLIDFKNPGLKRIGRLILPAIIGLSATQINIFINTNFASRCQEGSVAWLNYAFRLMQFPIGLFGVALSTAAFPAMAKIAAKGKTKELGRSLVTSLVMVFIMAVPSSIGLWILSKPIISIIYQHGHFSGFDTLMTAEALKFYAVGLMAYSAVKVIVPVYYALDDTKWPVMASFFTVILNVIIIFFTLERFQHRAIALSTSLTIIFNFLFLAFILYKKIGGYPVVRLSVSFLKIVIASVLMGVAVETTWSLLPVAETWGFMCFNTFFCITIGVLCYLIVILFLGVDEVKDIVSSIISRIRPRT